MYANTYAAMESKETNFKFLNSGGLIKTAVENVSFPFIKTGSTKLSARDSLRGKTKSFLIYPKNRTLKTIAIMIQTNNLISSFTSM